MVPNSVSQYSCEASQAMTVMTVCLFVVQSLLNQQDRVNSKHDILYNNRSGVFRLVQARHVPLAVVIVLLGCGRQP